MLESVLDKDNYMSSKLPHHPLTFCTLKAFESQAKGNFDHKGTGREQTNGKRMNCLQSFAEVGKALLVMHEKGIDVNLWLKKEIRK